MEKVRAGVGSFIYPGSAGTTEANQITIGKTIDLEFLQLDIQDNTRNGRVHFLHTWLDKHRAFFDAYEHWLVDVQGLYEWTTAPASGQGAAAAGGGAAAAPSKTTAQTEAGAQEAAGAGGG